MFLAIIVLTYKVSENFKIFFKDFVVNKLLDKSNVDNLSYLISFIKLSKPLSVILLFFNYKLFN